jgi:toxin-antitoxin system PIN domain toxin
VLVPDVNILLGAHQQHDPNHAALLRWLTQAAAADSEPLGISELVLSGVTRIATNHRAYPVPSTPAQAIEFCEQVRRAPATQIVAPGPRHWSIFAELVTAQQLRANAVPDAYLAALALEHRATFVTRDRGFARFAGLRLADPLTSR